jgi:radical SAM/Cys-rich protein
MSVLTHNPRDAERTVQQRDSGAAFTEVLRRNALAPLVRTRVRTLQVNMGKLCNMACHHCHVEAGPKRTEVMPRSVAERLVQLLEASADVQLVDITGGAAELNPSFRWLVAEVHRLGLQILDRCNLTVLLEPGQEDLAEFLAAHEVRVVASLPCYQAENVEKQRGRGAFDKSIEALRRLCSLGYGRPGSALGLDLVYNPVGSSLPPPQTALEASYKAELGRRFGIELHRVLTITNMPIRRFADFLERTGQYEAYMAMLVNHFNPATVPGLMCRSLVSVSWDGRLFDCDFNQMLEIDLGAAAAPAARSVWDVASLDELDGQPVATAGHCFGCTAGSGSSCGGTMA